MAAKNLICVVIDRLHAGMLGAYGNSWIRTRELDRLASTSFLFDQAYLESPRLDDLYRAYWQGQNAADKARGGSSFPRLLSESGWHTALISDERRLADFAAATDFAEQSWVETPPASEAAATVSDTQTACLFDRTVEWLSAAREPFCLWVHARGMEGAWDAPQDLREAYADDEDPPPPQFVDVPNRWLPERFDPDELLGITHAYAGQIAALDACIGGLLDHLEVSGRAATTQLTLLAARGFPLGEHRRVGACDSALYNELVQIAWLMRFPDGLGRLARTQALAQPFDLPLSLLDWLDIERGQFGSPPSASLMPIIRGDQEAIRDHVCLASEADRAIRTPAWLLRRPTSGPSELHAKPSDRWEVNEVSRLCGEVVEGLQQVLQQTEQTGQAREAKPLPDLLVTEVD